MAQFEFNSNDIPDDEYQTVEPGEYIACVVDSSIVENQRKNGFVMKLTFEILEGKFKGSKIFSNLNIRHENEIAERIGNQALKQLCVAVGQPVIEDTCQLHDIPVKILVAKQKNDPSRVEIKKYLSASASAASNSSSSNPPWAKKRA